MISNQVIYKTRLTEKEVYEGCSFRCDRLEVQGAITFEKCNFNCTETVILTDIMGRPTFKNCLFVGDVYVHFWDLGKEQHLFFWDCKIKSLIIGAIWDLQNFPIFNGKWSGIEGLKCLRLDKEKYNKEEEYLESIDRSDVTLLDIGDIENGYFDFMKLILAYNSYSKFDIYLGKMKFTSRGHPQIALGRGWMYQDVNRQSVMYFQDEILGKEFSLINAGELNKIFVSRKMVDTSDMAKIARYTIDNDLIMPFFNLIHQRHEPRYKELLLSILNEPVGEYPYFPYSMTGLEIDSNFLEHMNFSLLSSQEFDICAWGNSGCKYWWGSDINHRREFEVFSENSLHPTGSTLCNGLGLHDMYTNMPEMVKYHRVTSRPNPMVGAGSIMTVGVDWGLDMIQLRGMDFRGSLSPDILRHYIGHQQEATCYGFRLKREL